MSIESTLSPFARWHGHRNLLGKEFINTHTGERVSRFILYLKFQRSPLDLKALLDNAHPNYYQVDKPGWKGGYPIAKNDK